jgi:hypothetical protein
MLIYNFQRIFHQICWARAIIRRKIKSDLSDRLTDGRTDELIWGGLGNLRFLQEKHSLARGLEEQSTE